MPVEQIFFGNDQRSGDHELAGASPLAVNVITDGAGAVSRRPGIAAWDGFPASVAEDSPVEGLHAWKGHLYYVNGNRHLYRIDPDTASSTDLSTGGGDSYLAGTRRPVFAETPFRLVISGGGAPEKIDYNETVAERLGGSPPNSSHMSYLIGRLVSNDTTDATTDNQIRVSRANGNASEEIWDVLDLVRAAASPDAIVAQFSNSNELFVFGERTLQVFVPDANSILSPQRTMNRGCAAPYSIVESDESFGWFDDKRRFLLCDGRGVEEVGAPIARTLDGIATPSDCFGFRWIADQYDVLTWVFPSDGRSFAIQQGGGWAQWHGWTTGQGHTLLPVRSHHYWPEENVHLVGLADGSIAQLSTSAPTDLGETIKAEALTGFMNRGTDAFKFCQSVRFMFKRGHTSSATVAPQVLLSWRDSQGAFCSPIRMSLGVASDPVFTVEQRSLGTYRARQWKLEFTDALDFVLVRCEETYALGGQN